MAPPPGYDPELLRQLVTEHPDWSAYTIAKALTEDNRNAPPDSYRRGRAVATGTVQSAIHRYRPVWEADGYVVAFKQPESEMVRRLLRESSAGTLPRAIHQNSLPLRRLRQVERLRAGAHVAPEEASKARGWEARMRQERTVVDMDPSGQPNVRPARPDELDRNGDLIDLIARPLPGTPWLGDPESFAPDPGDLAEVAIWDRDLPLPAKIDLIARLRAAVAEATRASPRLNL